MSYTDNEAATLHAAGQAAFELRQTDAAFNELRGDLTRLLLESNVEDRQAREDAYHMIRALDLVRGKLLAKVQGGQVAEHSAEMRALLDEE
ncbi:MAG: hypothetical protein ABFE01_04995 [Phycisphaerales bacterium]